MATMINTDRIEKQILIDAPRSRVWRALTDAADFGAWFGVDLNGRFAPGQRLTGQITIPGYQHVVMDITVDRMEPERLVSWRWHPSAIEAGRDYSSEPTTLVVFELEEAGEGVLLKVVESGFDALPASRRAEAFRGNERGWTTQVENIRRHVLGTK
jgi:uncharacterized protein YndB with AHSA1/START domain